MSESKARTTGYSATNNPDMAFPTKRGPGNAVPGDEGERPAVELDATDSGIEGREVTRETAATTYNAFSSVAGATPTLLLGKDQRRKRVVLTYYDNAPVLMIGNRSSLEGASGYLVPPGIAFETYVTDETYVVTTDGNALVYHVWIETYA